MFGIALIRSLQCIVGSLNHHRFHQYSFLCSLLAFDHSSVFHSSDLRICPHLGLHALTLWHTIVESNEPSKNRAPDLLEPSGIVMFENENLREMGLESLPVSGCINPLSDPHNGSHTMIRDTSHTINFPPPVHRRLSW